MISSKMSALMLVGLVATMLAMAEAQSIPSCASKLFPCLNYLNSTNPPATCCDPIRETITNELPCLCSLYNDPNLLPNTGINVTQVLMLPRYCNINIDLSACNESFHQPKNANEASVTRSSSREDLNLVDANGHGLKAVAPSPSSVPPPPAVPGGRDGNGVGKISWTGMPSVLLILASMMLS